MGILQSCHKYQEKKTELQCPTCYQIIKIKIHYPKCWIDLECYDMNEHNVIIYINNILTSQKNTLDYRWKTIHHFEIISN